MQELPLSPDVEGADDSLKPLNKRCLTPDMRAARVSSRDRFSEEKGASEGLNSEDVTIELKALPDEKISDTKIRILVRGSNFVDRMNRRKMLRGINVTGSSKMPITPYGSTHLPGLLDNVEDVDFIGRPFPLKDCDTHFRRLQAWGFNFMRLVITWESVEHRGPGLYDYKFIEYLREVVVIAGKYNIDVYVDPHQDVWSRFSGGCGAPAWTLELVGFDLQNLTTTGAAVLQQDYQPSPDDFPKMLWPTNLYKLACATMFTLFWSGNDFAPNLLVGEGKCSVEALSCARKWAKRKKEKKADPRVSLKTVTVATPIQDYLQDCYISAMRVVAEGLRGLENVSGFGTMNEPHNGYHGQRNLSSVWGQLTNGVFPTPLQSFAVADGQAITVRRFIPGFCAFACGCACASYELNTEGKRAWLEGRECVWRMHGVWDIDESGSPRLKKPTYFANDKDWSSTYFIPFAKKYAEMMYKIDREWHVYLELPPIGVAPDIKFPKITKTDKIQNPVNATHWYDGFSLFSGNLQINWNVDVDTAIPKFGNLCVRSMFKRQIGAIRQESEDYIEGGAPTLIGEFGIPFNANGSQFDTGDFSECATLLDMNFEAMEANRVHYTLWNYTPDNDNRYGDHWNFEDLSVFSKDQEIDGYDCLPPAPEVDEKIVGDTTTFTLTNQGAMRKSFLYNGGRALSAVSAITI
uniref:Glycoside hydrolase family 5 domain-containing protein n=1 Tax=Lotharella globosa TaxID=91324 RepID=A0A7S3YXW6_9EUKA